MPSPQGPNSASAVRVTWRSSAACLDEDPDLSSLSGSRAPRCTAQMTPRPSAVSVRSLRPAGSALWSGQKTSVFGGLSEDERRSLKRPLSSRRVKCTAPYATDRELHHPCARAVRAGAGGNDASPAGRARRENRGGESSNHRRVSDVISVC